MSENEKPEGGEKKDGGAGFFTGRLAWWQVLLAAVLVGYLRYGKYEETKANAGHSPAVAPAKTK